MRRLTRIVATGLLITIFAGTFFSAQVFAQNPPPANNNPTPTTPATNESLPKGEALDLGGLPDAKADPATLQKILQIVFTTIGAISVLVVAYGGFKYVISQGNPQETAKAKDTILYAMVGLAVAIFANVIVSFVASKL